MVAQSQLIETATGMAYCPRMEAARYTDRNRPIRLLCGYT